MIEKVVLDYLSEKLQVPVYMEEPEEKQESFVVIEKTGSGKRNGIFSATLAVRSYAASMLEAAELNEQVKEKMEEITELDDVSSGKLNSDYNYTDTRTKRYRYQAVYDLIHY